MNKTRAKINFVLASIMIALALVLCFVQFKLPFFNNDFAGMFNKITATNDITSGITAVYEITNKDAKDEEVNETIQLMRNIIKNNGIDNANVYRQGNHIRAEVQATSNAGNVLAVIGTPTTFFISGTEQETITEEELADYDIVGTDIKNAFATTQTYLDETVYGITIEFTNSGADKYHELSKQVSATEASKVFFYIGGQQQSSLQVEETKDKSLSFYYSSKDNPNMNFDSAQTFALQILMSSTGVELEIVSSNTSSPALGNNTLLICMILFASLLVLTMIILPFIYGDLGFVANLSILAGVALNIFGLQALPFTTSSVAGIVGSMIGMGLLVLCNVLYLNKMKSEFKLLKKLQLSARTGFKKSWLKNLDICAITFIGAVSLALWNIPFVSTFGVSLALGSFIALLNTVVIFKDFITWYVWINTKNYKRVKFTKEEGNE